MKPKIFSGYLSSAFYAALLSVALPLSAEETKGVEIHLSAVELQEIFNNPRRSYVYVGSEISGIANIMAELAELDDNPASLIRGLAEHIAKGFNIGNYDAVAQALEEAELLLINKAEVLGEERAQELTKSLDAIIEQVIEEKLNLDSELLSFLKDSVIQEDATRSGCCKPKPHCHGLRLLVVKEKVDFQGKVKFREDVRFKDDVIFEDDVTFEDEVTFEDPATFENNVVVEGTLSVTDIIINGGSGILSVTDFVASTIDALCDLTVGCNINMVNSTDVAHGNVFKAGSPFIHNFGTDNTFVGINAGNFTTSGTGQNTALGVNVLSANTTGESNVAVGFNALASLTSGISNVAVGDSALNATTTPNYNIGVGSNTLLLNTTGTRNVAVGDAGLSSNIVGNNNIAVGKDSLFASTGSNNTAIGDGAAIALTTGSNIIAIGASAGGTVTTGSNDIYVGASAAAAAEANTIRIGALGTQTRCFVQGISGVVTGLAAIPVLVDANGQLGTISSSRDVKHDIQDMGSASNNVMNLRPVTFVYNGDESNQTRYGLIGEEVDAVFPALAVKDANGKVYSVHYETLPILLLNELQKLAARVAALEAMQQ